jgi:hypothetical protein
MEFVGCTCIMVQVDVKVGKTPHCTHQDSSSCEFSDKCIQDTCVAHCARHRVGVV